MYKRLSMASTVRKNFAFEEDIAKKLEELAKESKKSMTAFIQELIEERYKQKMHKRKIEAFKKINGSATGLLKDKSIQSIKSEYEI